MKNLSSLEEISAFSRLPIKMTTSLGLSRKLYEEISLKKEKIIFLMSAVGSKRTLRTKYLIRKIIHAAHYLRDSGNIKIT